MKIKVIVETGENGYYVAHCPSLKSCWSQGKTKKEALENIYEAIELYLEPDLEGFKIDENHEIYEIVI
jgi:predicted RNase H-like HicB family nuclease